MKIVPFLIGIVLVCLTVLAQPDLDISGIVGGDEPFAVINGKIVKVGGVVNGAEVVAISDDGVEVKYEGSSFLLRIDGHSQKDEPFYSTEYRIVKEEASTYKAVVKNLSSYSSEELEKLPIVIRKEYKVVVPEGLSEAQVKSVTREIIRRKLKSDNDIDEMIIFLYDDERDTGSFYTVGKAVWAVNGKLGEITPQIAKDNVKRKHKISFDIKPKKLASDKPTERELEIYYAHYKALWQYDSSPEGAVAEHTAGKFGITAEEVDRIYKRVSVWKLGR